MSTVIYPARVQALEYFGETGILYTDFTNGGAAAGTYTCKFTLPVDFFIHQIAVNNVVGFAGDTTAVIIVGDGSDTDRLNTGTPSVLTTTSSLDMGPVSGTQPITTAFQPVITVTGGADWDNVSAGSLDIKVYGWMVD